MNKIEDNFYIHMKQYWIWKKKANNSILTKKKNKINETKRNWSDTSSCIDWTKLRSRLRCIGNAMRRRVFFSFFFFFGGGVGGGGLERETGGLEWESLSSWRQWVWEFKWSGFGFCDLAEQGSSNGQVMIKGWGGIFCFTSCVPEFDLMVWKI